MRHIHRGGRAARDGRGFRYRFREGDIDGGGGEAEFSERRGGGHRGDFICALLIGLFRQVRYKESELRKYGAHEGNHFPSDGFFEALLIEGRGVEYAQSTDILMGFPPLS